MKYASISLRIRPRQGTDEEKARGTLTAHLDGPMAEVQGAAAQLIATHKAQKQFSWDISGPTNADQKALSTALADCL